MLPLSFARNELLREFSFSLNRESSRGEVIRKIRRLDAASKLMKSFSCVESWGLVKDTARRKVHDLTPKTDWKFCADPFSCKHVDLKLKIKARS